MTRLPQQDLDHVLAHTLGLWDALRDAQLFMTGGTGFFGTWLLASFLHANDRLGLNARALVLSRDPDAFGARMPHLADHRAVSWLRGDVRDFAFPAGRFSHVIHAATEARAKLNATDPLSMFDTIVTGTRRVLEFARDHGAHCFLLTSSGAVYGRQPPDLAHVPEEYGGGPDPLDPGSAYGEGKRAAEYLCATFAQQYGLRPMIARGFAFVGPLLPLDEHFAMGNFIRDGLRGGPIEVVGDGTPYRSYMHAADLAIWLWTILLRGTPCRPYNVGSETAVTVEETARAVARAFDPPLEVRIGRTANRGVPVQRCVPSTARAREELGLVIRIALDDAVGRTVDWYRSVSSS